MKKTVKWLLRCSIALGVFLAAMNFGSVTAEARVPKNGESVYAENSSYIGTVTGTTKLKYTTCDTNKGFYIYIIHISTGKFAPAVKYTDSLNGWKAVGDGTVLDDLATAKSMMEEEMESIIEYATEAMVQALINGEGEFDNAGWADDGGDDNEEEELKDSDTYKSCLPAKSIMARSAANASHIDDLKVHELSASDAANQKFLADSFATKGKNVKIIASFGVFPRRDLAIGENGSAQTLIWNNLSYKTPNTVHAVCYNTTDGAYVINGTIDDKGVAVLTGFKLRPVTNVTLYVEE